MFTMAAVKPLCFGVFAFVFPFSFLFMTTGTNRFAESVVSLLCAWRQKKAKQKQRKAYKRYGNNVCECDAGLGTGEDDDTDLYT